jgi:RNA binding exosome subunit
MSSKVEKLSYEDSLMLENIVEKLNELIDEINYLHSRVDKHWAYHRRLLKDKISNGEKDKVEEN